MEIGAPVLMTALPEVVMSRNICGGVRSSKCQDVNKPEITIAADQMNHGRLRGRGRRSPLIVPCYPPDVVRGYSVLERGPRGRMEQPEEYEMGVEYVMCKPIKSLDGLKQAPRV
jgi:hypothetical protein